MPDERPAGGEEPAEPAAVRRRLRDALAPGAFAHVVELVPWRGTLDDGAGARVRALAAELRDQPEIAALSITDSAGGHAMLSPEVLAGQLAERGQEVIVHVTCRDRNRNELLSLGWRLGSAGIGNLLVLSGDYPTEGYLGTARPVFDLDSVSLLALYDASNRGAIGGGVLGRTRIRDRARHVPPLEVAPGYARAPAATDFLLGCAVNPFKRLESELVPQYQKLAAKARAGARFAITQVGYDPRALEECARFVALEDLPLRLLANVFVLSRGAARVFASGEVPGVTIHPALVERVERQAASPDRGRAFFLDLAARQVAIARGLGYAGAYIGGTAKGSEIARIIELASAFGPDDWRELARTDAWPLPRTYRMFGTDAGTGRSSGERSPRGRSRRIPLAYRANRLVHRIAFTPGTRGFRTAAGMYGAAERLRLGHVLHVAEQAVKIPLFDCRDCGDCSLPEIAYLCPESQCVKNQRNGPCGGSRDGDCEVAGVRCIWTRAYERLAPYGEADTMLLRPPTIPDHALRRTSAWANTFLGRDHAGRTPAEPSRDER